MPVTTYDYLLTLSATPEELESMPNDFDLFDLYYNDDEE